MMLKRLFEKALIGNMELRNRIVMTAMNLGYANKDGSVTDRMIDFYTERAKGGVGLITVGVCYTEPLGHDLPLQVGVDDDSRIPKLKELTGSVQKYGARICCQIGHGGRYSHPGLSGGHPVAPSPVQAPIFTAGITPKELSIPEIQSIVRNFGEAARRVKQAGFDAVELAASGGILIGQFLSPVTNKRTDRYGGELKDRITFFLEIIEEVRGRVGKDYPLLARICGSDYVPGSHALAEQKVVAQEIEKAGVDCINVNIGWEEAPYPMLQMTVPRGTFLYLAQGIKSVVGVPVIGGVRINDPVLAEKAVEDGKVDLVTMARALIADPELPRKAMEGRLEEIRMCVGCNERCMDNIFGRPPLPATCLVNVQAGREKELEVKPASRRKRVAVIGGGPAGMEAARVAAIRGHDVRLYEKEQQLGGALNIGSMPPGKEELRLIPGYYSTQLPRIGVQVHLAIEATPETIRREDPEAVVVATGGKRVFPGIPGIERGNVVSAEDVLTGKAKVGHRVVIMGGGATGCETALCLGKKDAASSDVAVFLATSGMLPVEEALGLTQQGRAVTILEMLPRAGTGIGPNMRFPLMQDLRRLGVKTLTGAKVEEITSEGVFYAKEGKREFIAADTVVNALSYKPDNEIYQKLQGMVSELYLIGDSKEPRRAIEAIEEGFLTGRAI